MAGPLFVRSGLSGSADRAHARAGTAGHAGIRVDDKLAVTLRDGGNGTFLCARAARNALVADLICHDKYLLFFVENIIHPIDNDCNIQNAKMQKSQ